MGEQALEWVHVRKFMLELKDIHLPICFSRQIPDVQFL